MPTWLITGCSTGLGRALAQAVLERGDNAVVTARDPAKVRDLEDAYPDTAVAVGLDVTDPAQVNEAVRAAVDRLGAVDVLVNNAGYGYRAAVEEGDDGEVQELFATNLFGAISMIKAVLPDMRKRRSGAIVNISSIGARVAPPGSGYYAASKSALEAVSSSLHKELSPLHIKVMVVEPGGFRTDFAGRSLQQSPGAIADYAETAGPRRKENDRVHGTQPGDPGKAAQVMIAAVGAENPPFMLLLGQDSLDGFRATSAALNDEVATWEHLTVSTGFGE